MVALLIVLTAIPLDEKNIDSIVNAMWLGSTSIGVLSLFLSHPYRGTVSIRQVLFLFGRDADPNNQAAFLVVGFTIALYNLISKKEHLLLSIATIAVNTYSLFLTGSRGGLVSLACVGMVLLITSSGEKGVVAKVRLVLIVALVGGALYFLVTRFLPVDIFGRLFNISTYESGSGRDIIWANGWELFTSDLHFLFGAGWGAYYGYNEMYNAMHNTFLSMLCDVGIVGCLFFFVPIVKACFDFIINRSIFPVLLLIGGFVPSFFIEAVNKRFFWNAIFLLFIFWNDLKCHKQNEGSLRHGKIKLKSIFLKPKYSQ